MDGPFCGSAKPSKRLQSSRSNPNASWASPISVAMPLPQDLTREHKADLEVVHSEHLCGEQAGKANYFGRGLLFQDGYTRQALAEAEKLPHHLACSFQRHRYALKDVAHHLAVTQNPLMHDRDVLLGRGAQDQARRRQNDDRLLLGNRRGSIVHWRRNTAIHRWREVPQTQAP
jgi:hypothetical protein